jgi:hypothetical protein
VHGSGSSSRPREVEVVDDAEVDAGFVVVRSRTWNVMHAHRFGQAPPDLSAPRRIAIAQLWDWHGQPWGGAVPDQDR